MRLPKQAAPVKRPDIIYPHRAVDVVHGTGENLLGIRMQLLHGANYNDPPQFNYQNIRYGNPRGCGEGKSACNCGCS